MAVPGKLGADVMPEFLAQGWACHPTVHFFSDDSSEQTAEAHEVQTTLGCSDPFQLAALCSLGT